MSTVLGNVTLINILAIYLFQVSEKFNVKAKISILGFGEHRVYVATTQVCFCDMKIATENT